MEKLRRLVNEIAYTPRSQSLSPLHLSLLPLLSLSSSLYKLLLSLRHHLYHLRLLPQRRLPVPVISVGNLTWGGNGKTPMVEFIALLFDSYGISPLILTRCRGWKNRFFFVDRTSIGEKDEISSQWNKGDIDWGELFPPAEDTLSKIEEFFRLPPDKRSPKGLLEASSIIPEDLKASTSAIMSTVSKPVVSGSDFDLDDIEAMFSAPIVKIEKKPPPAPKKIPVPDESIGIGSRVRKRKAIQEEVVEVEDTFEEMSVGDFKKKCMSFTTGAVGLMEGLVKETEIVRKKSKADIALVKKEKTMLENKIKEHEKTLEQQVKSLAEQEQTVKDLLNSLAKSEDDHNKEIAEVKNSCKLAAAKTVSQCKVKMMKEYQEGKADTWDINRECAYLFKLTGEVTDEGEVSSSPYETIVKDAPVVGEVTPNATPAAEAT